MYVGSSYNPTNSYPASSTAGKKTAPKPVENNNTTFQQNLVVGKESYSVFISTEAFVMATTKTDSGGNLIVGSEEEKENLLYLLGKNKDKIVNQAMKKFCEDNGIDTSQPIEKLESYIVVETEEMKRKTSMNSASIQIKFDAKNLLDAFKGGDFDGQLPTEAIYSMFKNRFHRYANNLTEYVEKYGVDERLHQDINDFLQQKNPTGTNHVANLLKKITDKIFSGTSEDIKSLINNEATTAFERTFEKEIVSSNNAMKKRAEKFETSMHETKNKLSVQADVIREKIKKLQEQLRELTKNPTDPRSQDQIRTLSDELALLQKQLNGLNVAMNGGSPSSERDWSDMSILDW